MKTKPALTPALDTLRTAFGIQLAVSLTKSPICLIHLTVPNRLANGLLDYRDGNTLCAIKMHTRAVDDYVDEGRFVTGETLNDLPPIDRPMVHCTKCLQELEELRAMVED